MNKKTFLFGLFAIISIFIVYRPWYGGGEIIGGDWPYLFSEMVRSQSYIPSSWQSGYGGGLGGISPAYFLSIYNFFSSYISVAFGLPWVFVYKVFWFITPLALLASGGFSLAALLFPRSTAWPRFIASLIIATNTYILMVTGGGQMGVFFAVSLCPWVLIAFFRFLRFQRLRETLLLGTIFGIQISFDPRFAYISIISMGVLYWFEENALLLLWRRLRFGFLAGGVSVLLNFYWILPLLVLKENTLDTLGSAYTTVEALRFFSFADFSHALSLLHPNWPENLFGKTYFLQPEFILLPIVAFSSLFFTKKLKKNGFVFGFAMLGLLGAFLSKGANEPFGFLYVWLFEHIPGFVMFRDPTKFYVLTMTSFAVLIPFALFSISNRMKKYQKSFLWMVPWLFILYWLVLIRPAVMGSLGGTFTKQEVPSQYVVFKELLQKEYGFFRTLWVPRQSRFTFTSSNQLSIEAGPLLGATDAASLGSAMQMPTVRDQLESLSIRYIVVPFDPYGEIFTDDRKYSQTKRGDIEKTFDAVPWLTKIQSSDIAVYETLRSKDHFWIENGIIPSWRKIADDYYEVDVVVQKPTKLMMSESYHQGWQAHIKDVSINASKEPFGIMSYALQQEGSHTVIIEFVPRRWYMWGKIISLITLILLFLIVFKFYSHDK